VRPQQHSSTHEVGEAYAHVQGESLKAYAALLVRLLNSPITRSERQMRIHVVVIGSVLVLSACANDHYTVIPNGPGSEVRMADDLWDCKMAAEARYQHATSHNAVALGVLFGPIGAGVGGSIDQEKEKDNPGAQLSNINPNIERCMHEHGYDGTSEN
jgi:hypothetical protein